MPKLIKPAYLHHKATGQARCRINGKDHYLGSYGSPQSREKYAELIDEWFARNGDTSRHDLTIDDLAILFLKFAANYYRREDGESTGEAKNVRDSLRPLIRQFGETRIREFGPIKLKSVRDEMVKAGLCRTNFNSRINRIRRVFKWGAENEHVPAPIFQGGCRSKGTRKNNSVFCQIFDF